MGDFGLIIPFGVDNGELDDLTPAECFVLGYELAVIIHRLQGEDGEWDCLFHVENAERIEAAVEREGRVAISGWMPGDQSESWMKLSVLPRRVDGDG